jgi:hypothetical protein
MLRAVLTCSDRVPAETEIDDRRLVVSTGADVTESLDGAQAVDRDVLETAVLLLAADHQRGVSA